MKRVMTILGTLMLVTASARATTILDFGDALALSDPTQLGRLSRSGIPSDWSAPKAFPGVLNTSTTYHYKSYLVDPGVASFIQIDILENNNTANMFVSAYDTAYLPNSAGGPNFGFDTNFLGDAGFSGNPFPNDPEFFQVIVPQGHKFLVVVNDTVAGNGGIGTPFHLTVEGFIDSEFTDPPVAAVPEPATILLAGTGLAFFARRRRRSVRLSADLRMSG